MANNTLQSLVAWMQDPRNNVMWGWDSIAAMARGKVNDLLLKDYITRFTSGSYLEPMSGEVALVGDAFIEKIHKFILDAPRLAFTNDDLGQSHATLSCSILGGTQLTMKNNVDNWEAYRVIHIDALQGPILTLDLALEKVPGIVLSDGRVMLDLNHSDNFILTFAADHADRRLGGDLFKRLFNKLRPEQRIWTLGEIKRGNNNLMHPQSFKLRTQSNPAASLDPQAASYGDGAILAFIRLEGSQEGGDIPVEYQYLIPDDANKDYSATVLFSAERTFKAALVIGKVTEAIASVFENISFDNVHDASGRLIKATAIRGTLSVEQPWAQAIPFLVLDTVVNAQLFRSGSHLDASGPKPLSVELAGDGRAVLTWTAEAVESIVLTVPYRTSPVLVMQQVVTVDVECIYTFAEERNDLVLIPYLTVTTRMGEITEMPTPPDITLAEVFLIAGVSATFEQRGAEKFESRIRGALQNKLATSVSISSFIRDSIHLNFEEAIVPDVLRAPRDIAVFGRIHGGSQANFIVSPQEHQMVVDSTVTFSVQPPGAEVKWSLERLQGDEQDYGAINDTTGKYYAPEAPSSGLAFTRVRVTATDTSGLHSSALVTIVANPITVNPLIQVCDAGQTVELAAGLPRSGPDSRAAGSPRTEELEWSIKHFVPGESGELKPSALFDGDHCYVAVPKLPGKTYVLDEILVTSTKANASSWVLVRHQPSLLVVKVVKVVKVSKANKDVKLSAVQVQLQASANGNVVSDAVFKVAADGPGSVTEGGLYTAADPSDAKFVLIFASFPHPVFGNMEGHIIVPLPLDEFDEDLALMKGRKVKGQS
ncbi:hypothetical protein BW686_11835 [Pseudomonas syringae]|uniref:Uncharacterized protein n=1 Tax=Pseudomonas syringae TaxID=317 RepID=A0A244ERI0_PSESX|nr:hypothetical protein [Pseudomonas syringae]OUM07096.1 hypothetical protein BW686_11835 [Pseudomonas syringae]